MSYSARYPGPHQRQGSLGAPRQAVALPKFSRGTNGAASQVARSSLRAKNPARGTRREEDRKSTCASGCSKRRGAGLRGGRAASAVEECSSLTISSRCWLSARSWRTGLISPGAGPQTALQWGLGGLARAKRVLFRGAGRPFTFGAGLGALQGAVLSRNCQSATLPLGASHEPSALQQAATPGLG